MIKTSVSVSACPALQGGATRCVSAGFAQSDARQMEVAVLPAARWSLLAFVCAVLVRLSVAQPGSES